jgi:hypothetical protein
MATSEPVWTNKENRQGVWGELVCRKRLLMTRRGEI